MGVIIIIIITRNSAAAAVRFHATYNNSAFEFRLLRMVCVVVSILPLNTFKIFSITCNIGN